MRNELNRWVINKEVEQDTRDEEAKEVEDEEYCDPVFEKVEEDCIGYETYAAR